MRPNDSIKKCLISLILVYTIVACHSAGTSPGSDNVISFNEPEAFYVKELSQPEPGSDPRLYWTFVYSNSTRTVQIRDNLASDRVLREFNILSVFQNGNRIFYKEFYDTYDPYLLKKGLMTQLDHYSGDTPAHFYWYHVILLTAGEGVTVKKQIVSENDSIQIEYDKAKVDIISEGFIPGKVFEHHGWVETPLSWIDSWTDTIKKQKINKPF